MGPTITFANKAVAHTVTNLLRAQGVVLKTSDDSPEDTRDLEDMPWVSAWEQWVTALRGSQPPIRYKKRVFQRHMKMVCVVCASHGWSILREGYEIAWIPHDRGVSIPRRRDSV